MASDRKKNNKKNPNWKGRSKTVTVCRRHDTIYKKILKHHQKTIRTNKEFSKVSGYKIKHRNLLHFYTLTTNYQKDKHMEAKQYATK